MEVKTLIWHAFAFRMIQWKSQKKTFNRLHTGKHGIYPIASVVPCAYHKVFDASNLYFMDRSCIGTYQWELAQGNMLAQS
jgi:hypothetical protein